MNSSKLVAVLWDLDGTLVDSEPLWQAARDRLALQNDIEWTSLDHQWAIGRTLYESAERMRARGLKMTVGEINARIIDDVMASVTINPQWRPGALGLVRALAQEGISNAIVTQAFRPLAELVARIAGDGSRLFDVVVAGDEVERGKPDPEAYMTALGHLGIPADTCIAVEDTSTGVTSAIGAGIRVLAVPYMTDLVGFDSDFVWVRDSLEGISVDRLRSFLPA